DDDDFDHDAGRLVSALVESLQTRVPEGRAPVACRAGDVPDYRAGRVLRDRAGTVSTKLGPERIGLADFWVLRCRFIAQGCHQGRVRTGLHPSVSSGTRDGFVARLYPCTKEPDDTR